MSEFGRENICVYTRRRHIVWRYGRRVYTSPALNQLIDLILPYVPYSPLCMHSIETAPLCKILEQSQPLFMEILHFEDLGDTSVVSECSLGVNLVIDFFFM